jgi:hypothetical protein
VGLIAAGGFIAWTTFCVYWVPSYRGWDALWYHEPMVGFAIQNHGFHVVPLPFSGAQKINSYPRAAEMTALWFTIFTDRRLIDLQSCLVAPFLMLAMYALAKRYCDAPATAVGWACALMLMPAVAQELQSLYVDLNYGWAFLVTAYFATRPVFRVRDAFYCAVAATIMLGTKLSAATPTPLFLVIALYRLAAQNPGRRRAVTGAALFGAALFLAMTASIYLRNYVVFHNPFWPDLKLDIPKWNIHFPGEFAAGERVTSHDGVDMNQDWAPFFNDALSEPYSWHRWHYGEIHDFGFAMPWVVWPIGALAMLFVAATLFVSSVGRALRRPGSRLRAETANVALLIVPLVVVVATSPARWSARYNVGASAILMLLCAWLAGRRGFARLGEGLSAVAIVSGITCNAWGERWWVWPTELVTLAKIPYPEREVTNAPKFTLGYHMIGSGAATAAGTLREKELGKGSVLVFPDSFGNYLAVLWNNRFSNKLVWVPDGDDWLGRAEKENPTWIYSTYGDPNYRALKTSPRWEEIGSINEEGWGAVFRRKK